MRKLKLIILNTSEKYWLSINEMPLENWIKCNAGDYRYSRKNPNLQKKVNETDAENWIRIYDQYIIKYDLSPLYKKMLKTMQKKALLQLEFVETWERFKLTQIEIEAERLKNMLVNNGEGMTIDESLVYLSKWLGYRLNIKETTVVEYFTILKQYGKNNKGRN